MNCLNCGKAIETPRTAQRFCRATCRYAWHRSRRPTAPSWKTALSDLLARQDRADAEIARLQAAVAALTDGTTFRLDSTVASMAASKGHQPPTEL